MTRSKILLVDDVHLFLEQQKAFFNEDEFDLVLARNGNEAIEILKKVRPELIFMDLFMPGMDGDICCNIIKSTETLREIPVIMVTTGVDERDFQKCWQAGCNDIIPKPINHYYFIAILKKYLPVFERKVPRFVARLRVQYGADQETLLDDYSINVSTGGLFIATLNIFPVGTSLTLTIFLPENENCIKLKGKVAWANFPDLIRNQNLPIGMGIQFVDLSLDQLNSFRDFLKNGNLLPYW